MSTASAHHTAISAGEVIAVLADYFGSPEVPTITEHFTPGRGWVNQRFSDPVSRPRVRQLKRCGVTSVALTLAGRTVDFHIAELLHIDRRCLLGSGPLPRPPASA